MKTREELIGEATEEVRTGFNSLKEPIQIIQVIATVYQSLLSNEELMRIIATAVVDIKEQITIIQSNKDNN